MLSTGDGLTSNAAANIKSNDYFKVADKKIRRGPKLEGYAFANFGNSSETEGESRPFLKRKAGKMLFSCHTPKTQYRG